MLGFDVQDLLIFGGIAAVIYFVLVPKANQAKKRIEARRTRSVDLAVWAKANGLPILGGLFSKYAAGDYSGTIAALDQVHDILADPALSKQAVDGFLSVQLGRALETAEGRENLVRQIEERLSITIPRDQIAALSSKKQSLSVDPLP